MKELLLYICLMFSAVQSTLAQSTLDLLIGESDGICYAFQNTGTLASPVWTARAGWNVPDVGSDVTPCYADLDNDGDWDLLVGEDWGECYAFENIGSKTSPIWSARPAWNVPNFSSDARPIMADLDGDCDVDVLIGENFGGTYFYENIGTITSPSWNAKPSLDLPDIGDDTRPAIADLDGDGDLDVLIGEDNGICYGYENIGTPAAPSWSAKPAWNVPDVGTEAAPTLGDIDGDGDYDLIVGAIDGTCTAFENVGSPSMPSWALKPAWNPPSVSGEAEPLLIDLDDDGNTNMGCVALSVELLYFKASQNGSLIDLNWVTASEINNDYFTIERSSDAINWEVVGIINGLGNSSQGKSYSFADEYPIVGAGYYRLKQTNFDASFSYSKTRVVNFKQNNTASIYPNPTKGEIFIRLTPENMESSILEIVNLVGQVVYQRPLNPENSADQIQQDLHFLDKGIYVVQIISGGQIAAKVKLVKE